MRKSLAILSLLGALLGSARATEKWAIVTSPDLADAPFSELLTIALLKLPELDLVEIIELKDHPWFLAGQFHPEFKSRPLAPHPLFRLFVAAGLKHAGGLETPKAEQPTSRTATPKGRPAKRTKGTS